MNSVQNCQASERTIGPGVRDCARGIDFTLLFEESILTILPICLLILFSPWRIVSVFRHSARVGENGWLLPAKMTTATVYACITVALVPLWVTQSFCKTETTIASAIMTVVANIPVVILLFGEHRFSVKPSLLLTYFLLCSLLFDTAHTRTLWLKGCARPVTIVFTFATAVKAFLLLFESTEKRSLLLKAFKGYTKEQTSGILTHSFSWWVTPLIWKGSSKQITDADLFTFADHDTVARKRDNFARRWQKHDGTLKSKSLFALLLRTSIIAFLKPVLPKLANIAINFAQPFLLRRVLIFLGGDEPFTVGYYLVGASVLVYVLSGLTKSEYDHAMNSFKTEVRESIIGALYDKIVCLPSSELNVGNISTMLNTDVDIIMMGLKTVHEAWGAVLTVGFAMWLLYGQLSYAFIAPTLTIVVIMLGTSAMGGILAAARMKWLKGTQIRLKSTVAAIQSIKGIKLLGLGMETFYNIQGLREREIGLGIAFRKLQSITIAISNGISSCSTLVAFGFFTIVMNKQNEVMTDTRLFTCLTLINIATLPVLLLVQSIPTFASLAVSIGRIQKFLIIDVHERKAVRSEHSSISSSKSLGSDSSSGKSEKLLSEKPLLSAPITITDGNFGWSSDAATIKDINLSIPRATITFVIGPNGSGKSTLLKSLLGESRTLKGRVQMSFQRIALCEQVPWLSNTTVKANIIGADLYDEAWYSKVKAATTVTTVTNELSEGDKSRVGIDGNTLSGGQKQRIALARAIYSRPDLLLLDDPFSSVDSNTEAHIVEHLLSPSSILHELGTTVILTTCSSKWLSLASHIIILNDGRVESAGAYSELNHQSLNNMRLDGDKNINAQTEEPAKPATSLIDQAADKKETHQESDWSVYSYYARTIGLHISLTFLAFLCLSAGLMTYQNVWLSRWAATNSQNREMLYIGVYAGLVIAAILLFFALCIVLLCALAPATGSILHLRLLKHVVNAHLSFFSTTSTGSLVNRFTQDFQLLDNHLPQALLNTLGAAAMSVGCIVIVIVGSPWAGLAVPLLLIVLWQLQRFYLKTSKQIRHLDLESKAPLNEIILETIAGISTIRAFRWQSTFKVRTYMLLRQSQNAIFHMEAVQIWLQLVLDLIIAVLVVLVTAISVKLRGSSSAAWVGLALYNLILLSQALVAVVTNWTSVETSIAAVSRIRQLCNTAEQEQTRTKPDAPEGWPYKGVIEFQGLSARHRHTPNTTLNNLNFVIKAAEKVALCGESGSGKTSLLDTMLCLLDITSGKLLIDGADITSISFDSVRSNIVTVPQEPLFVTGSIRQNLVLGRKRENSQIEKALEKVSLWDVVKTLGGLDIELDAASQLSQGQRQRFGMARALLTESRIVLLDEVTGSADEEFEHLVQKIVREDFRSRTVIAITHRLHTVSDFDRVLVMSAGTIIRQGTPAEMIGIAHSTR